jgi:hypothetical protein
MLLHQNQWLATILNSIQWPQCLRFNTLKPPVPRIAPPLGRPHLAFESNSNSARNLASFLIPPGEHLPIPAPRLRLPHNCNMPGFGKIEILEAPGSKTGTSGFTLLRWAEHESRRAARRHRRRPSSRAVPPPHSSPRP